MDVFVGVEESERPGLSFRENSREPSDDRGVIALVEQPDRSQHRDVSDGALHIDVEKTPIRMVDRESPHLLGGPFSKPSSPKIR